MERSSINPYSKLKLEMHGCVRRSVVVYTYCNNYAVRRRDSVTGLADAGLSLHPRLRGGEPKKYQLDKGAMKHEVYRVLGVGP